MYDVAGGDNGLDRRPLRPQAGAVGLTAGHDRGHVLPRYIAVMFTRELCPWTHFSLAEILVLVGGAILPAPVLPASTRISARLKCVQECSQFSPP